MFDPNQSAYFAIASQIYDRVVQRWQAENRIMPVEAQGLMNAKNGPEFMQCVQTMDAQLPTGSEQQIEQCLIRYVLGPLVENNRRRMASYGGYGNPGMPPNPGYGMRYSNPGYGGYGGYGYRNPNAVGGSWFSGSPGGGANPEAPNMFNMFKSNPGYRAPEPTPRAPVQKQPAKQEPEQPKKKWTPPVIDTGSKIKIEPNGSNQYMEMSRFVDSNDTTGLEVFVIDDRPRYMSGMDAINAYKGLLKDSGGKQFLTVAYKELIVLETSRHEFSALLADAAKAAGNISDSDVIARLEAVLAAADEHKASASTAFHKLLCAEFNEHIFAGELLDAKHTKLKVAVQNVQGILDLLKCNLNAKTMEVLHKIANFDARLQQIVRNVLNTIVFGGAQRKVLDPTRDKNCLDVYGKVIPPIWKNTKTGNWVVTGNLFTKFVGSKTLEKGAAESAAQAFNQIILQVDEQYTVVQVPRIITWTNTSSFQIVGWTQDGVCVPTVHNADRGVTGDTAFFLDRVLRRINASKIASYQAVPAKLVCEVEEQTRTLEYGITSDGDGTFWVGSLRFRS